MSSNQYLEEEMIYIDNNGQLSIYITYSVTNGSGTEKELVNEVWYNGTKTEGTMIMKNHADGGAVDVYEEYSVETMNMFIYNVSQSIPVQIYVLTIDEEISALENATLSYYEGFYFVQDLEGTSITYRNNKIIEVDGIEYSFPKSATATIPVAPSVA